MPVVSASNFTPAVQSLFPFTGTVKLGGDYEQSGGLPAVDAMRTEIAELRLKVAYQPGSATSTATECDTRELIDQILQAV